ncbi:hypothetical protein AOQ84DRAFT_187079 [Glonium stellatum]|uniref:Uncharacterized protein n=1 Tax=Glonium stellatum TaxID=574774 RepID=A0A8E2F6K9_9PEZI|nr:hypothetical protein AOQ84DRAFT_187079 [Glonium stellatum]
MNLYSLANAPVHLTTVAMSCIIFLTQLGCNVLLVFFISCIFTKLAHAWVIFISLCNCRLCLVTLMLLTSCWH